MSSKGILHTSVGSDLTKAEWEQDGSHYFASGTTFPAGAVESDVYYRADLKKLFQYNATSWVDLSNTVGTTDHGLMGGLTDDDHTQYLLGSGGRTLSGNWAIGGYDITGIKLISGTTIAIQQFRGGATFNASGEAPFLVSSTFNVTNLSADMIDGYHVASLALSGHTHDHGAIGGLLDDDHTQYLLASGGRTLSGDWAVSNWNITGIRALSATTLTVQQIVAGATFNASGAAPFIVSSTFNVTNLSVDFLDGQHSSAFSTTAHTHDHGALGGLADDDHTLYLLASGGRGLSASWAVGNFDITGVKALGATTLTVQQIVAGATFNASGAAPFIVNSTFNVTNLSADFVDGYNASAFALTAHTHDHGAIGGLGDDDHTIYLLATGARALSGAISHAGFDITNIGRATGVTIYVGTTDTYLTRYGTATLQTQNLSPDVDSSFALGTVGREWKNIYVDNIFTTSFGQAVSHGGYDTTNIGRVTGVTIYVGTTDTYLVRAGPASIQTHNIISVTDSTYNLGALGNEWKNLYVDNIPSAVSHVGQDITNVGRLTGVTINVGTTDTYLVRSGPTTLQTHNIVSVTDSTYSLGTVGNEWKNIYVDNIYATAVASAISHSGLDITNVGRVTGVTIYVGTTDTYLNRIGPATLGAQHVLPITDATYNVGGSANQFKNIYFSGTIFQGGTQFVGGSGVSDHGSLTGLADDDHSQYILASGGRALTGAWTTGAWSVSHSGADVTNVGRITGVTINVGTTDTYLIRSGATSVQTHNIVPVTDSTYALGTVGLEWKNLYVDNIYATAFASAISHGGLDATNIGRVTGITINVGTTDTYLVRSGAGILQTQNILSITDSTYGLGTVGNEWKNIYVDNIYTTAFASTVSHSGYDITNVGRATGVTIYVGTTDTYLTRNGAGILQTQNFVPDTDSSFALGTVGREWKNIYVDNIYSTAFAQGISHGGFDITNVGRATGVTIYVGTTDTYLVRSGPATVQTHNIVSVTDSTYNLGASGNEWKNLYVDTIYVSGFTFTGYATGLKDYLDAKFLSHTSITWTAGTGLTGGGDLSISRTLSVSHLGIQNLADPNVDKMIYWHDTGGTVSWLGIGTNLSVTAGTLNAGGGVTDHGALSGLTDDDHTIYSLVTGTRAYTGALSHGGFDITNVGRVTGVTIYVGTTDTSLIRYGVNTIQTGAFMSRGHMPETSASYDLGNSTAYWDDTYTNRLRFPNADEAGIAESVAVGISSFGTIRDAAIFGVALMAGADGFYRADADIAASVPVVGILAQGTVAAGSTGRVLFYGIIRRDAWSLTAGAPVYLSTTSGSVTSTAPSADGNQVQRIGVALTANVILFKPDLTVVEVVA